MSEKISKYITLKQASKLCPYSAQYLGLRARQGKLKAIKVGRDWITTKEWLQEYIQKTEAWKQKRNKTQIKKQQKQEIQTQAQPQPQTQVPTPSLKPSPSLPTPQPSLSLKPLLLSVFLLLFLFSSLAFGKQGLLFVSNKLSPVIQDTKKALTSLLLSKPLLSIPTPPTLSFLENNLSIPNLSKTPSFLSSPINKGIYPELVEGNLQASLSFTTSSFKSIFSDLKEYLTFLNQKLTFVKRKPFTPFSFKFWICCFSSLISCSLISCLNNRSLNWFSRIKIWFEETVEE